MTILKKSYEKLPTVTARPKTTEIRFSDMISVATPIESNHHIIRNELVRMHTAYKNTRGKVRSIYPSLVWHDTEKKGSKERICQEKNAIGIARNCGTACHNDNRLDHEDSLWQDQNRSS